MEQVTLEDLKKKELPELLKMGYELFKHREECHNGIDNLRSKIQNINLGIGLLDSVIKEKQEKSDAKQPEAQD